MSVRVGGDTFSFDDRGGRYVVRWNGKTYADGSSGKVAATDNVVVMSVKNKPDGNADVNGARSVKSATVGKGKVVVYRDGRKISGTWRRAGDTKPLRFVDADGRGHPARGRQDLGAAERVGPRALAVSLAAPARCSASGPRAAAAGTPRRVSGGRVAGARRPPAPSGG